MVFGQVECTNISISIWNKLNKYIAVATPSSIKLAPIQPITLYVVILVLLLLVVVYWPSAQSSWVILPSAQSWDEGENCSLSSKLNKAMPELSWSSTRITRCWWCCVVKLSKSNHVNFKVILEQRATDICIWNPPLCPANSKSVAETKN